MNTYPLQLTEIGAPPWNRDELIADLDEFAALYEQRPIRYNEWGMRSGHMFAVWSIARKLNPELIVENGVMRGQSTWLLEQACPNARLISIDPNLKLRHYISPRATYLDKDFADQDWSDIPEKALVFFDDHQNAYRRLQQCAWFGFEHIIFEDNYPPNRGDCYSLKKAWLGTGLENPPYDGAPVPPTPHHAKMLRKRIAVYQEFPPIFKTATTRSGAPWSDDRYPTPTPLLQESEKDRFPVYYDDVHFYNWLCYVRLKRI